MAEKKARHAFGQSSGIENAKQENKIDAFDILFLDGDTAPKVGWLDSQGNTVIVDHRPDLAKVEAELEAEIATKADTTEVNAKIDKAASDSVATAKSYTDGKVEAAINEHLVKKYEVTSTPEGALVNYGEKEIRVMCPENSVWTKQAVGNGGDPNSYYMTFKTYVYNDDVVGYIEHLGGQTDEEILTDLKTDEYGRRYQPTWLALAKYDAATDTWTYHGANSRKNHYIGWDYQIDWFDANGVMIASDSIRINLSNENCHSTIEPYYVGSMMSDIETMVDEKVAAATVVEVIEF
jgi:hypothetical protein